MLFRRYGPDSKLLILSARHWAGTALVFAYLGGVGTLYHLFGPAFALGVFVGAGSFQCMHRVAYGEWL